MVLPPAKSNALRATLAVAVASLVVLVPAFKQSFSGEVQPLLMNIMVMTLCCAGTTFEETICLAMESLLGTMFAVLNVGVIRCSVGTGAVDPYSFEGVAVLLESTLFVAVTCLLPVSINVKMYTTSNMAYFSMQVFALSYIHISTLLSEYFCMCTIGCLCVVLVYWPSTSRLSHNRAKHQAAATFAEVADGCASLVAEASAALLGSGAGESWGAISRERLGRLNRDLAVAKLGVSYTGFDPYSALRRLTSAGRAHAELWHTHCDAAFKAAGRSIDISRLLCKLAMHNRARDSLERVAAFDAVAACLASVAEAAGALLRDMARTTFMEAQFQEDEARAALRAELRRALRNSGAAAKELVCLSLYSQSGSDELTTPMAHESIATVRADMQAFLFLVHSLAVELLRTEAEVLRGAEEEGDRELGQRYGDAVAATPDPSPFVQLRRLDSNIASPLLGPKPEKEPLLREGHRRLLELCASVSVSVRSAVYTKWPLAFKVSLAYFLGFVLSLYFFQIDSTCVGSVTALCSYGSQYAGGSLRRSVNRGIGICIGASMGCALNELAHLLGAFAEPDAGQEPLIIGLLLLSILTWNYGSLLVYYHSGAYSYVGFMMALNGTKLMLADVEGTEHISSMIKQNMYACVLALAVEMGVMRVESIDLLRARVSASIAGVAVAFSALTTSQVSDAQVGQLEDDERSPFASVTPQSGKRSPKAPQSGKSSPGGAPAPRSDESAGVDAEGALPDLSERLKEAGVFEKYQQWSADYMRWRGGESKGAKGEVEVETKPRAVSMAPSRAKSFAAAAEEGEEGESAEVLVAQEDDFAPQQPAAGEVLDVLAGAVLEVATDGRVGAGEVLGEGAPAREQVEHVILLEGQDAAFAEATAAVAEAAEAADGELLLPSLPPDAQVALPVLAEALSSMEEAAAPADDAPKGKDQAPTAPVSLAGVQTLLAELQEALTPTPGLVAQAVERLDAERVDAHAWNSLAESLELMRLWLALLARLVQRLRSSVTVAALLSGEDPAESHNLVHSFSKALATATAAVAGGAAPHGRDCAELEEHLRSSSAALERALGRTRLPDAGDEAGALTAQVLAGSAACTVAALLSEAVVVLTHAVVVAGAPPPATPVAAPGGHADRPLGLALPDLTERLKRAGNYEAYVKWRDGYRKWREGQAGGAKGEIVTESTT